MSNSPYKKMLDEHGFCIVSPVGSSMLPLIEEGTDTVKIVTPTFPLKNSDYLKFNSIFLYFLIHIFTVSLRKLKLSIYYSSAKKFRAHIHTSVEEKKKPT